VVEQRGTIGHDYTIAREAAAAFYDRLRELFAERKSITTFGPYSPGQAVAMKRMGIEAIYLGGWATSAKGGTSEDPGPDLASYPLSQVPDEAATLVRALLSADRNQQYLRSRMTEAQRAALRSGLERLIDPAQMGNLFKVLALTSPGMPAPAGFE